MNPGMKKKSFYITTPIYYPNASLHMGHAYTNVLADILARYHRSIKGETTFFLSGTDDHSIQVAKVAEKAGRNPKDFVLEKGKEFKNLYSKLGVEVDEFIQTSDQEKHWPGAVLLWKKIAKNNDFEKRKYSGLYCIGCEAFKKEVELVDGNCPLHGFAPEFVEEENYFFKLSKYSNILRQKIESGEINIVPETRKKEILSFITMGLEDVSFSRPKKSISWGIPVPNDPGQVMYVWCDALTNYISALGYGRADDENFKKFWPADVHIMGKDILRFHAAIWPAMLISAGLPLPKNILVHGMINSGGRKMSKTLGNVINPLDIVKEYGTDALRYFLAREISTFEDGDFTMERFKDAYNANLANGLGNLVSRVMTMAETHLTEPIKIPEIPIWLEYLDFLNNFEINKTMELIWKEISALDLIIQTELPFKLVKTDLQAGRKIISDLVFSLHTVARMLAPILPETSEKILKLIQENKKPENPLFLRKD